GKRIPALIENYTGITNSMLINAPSNSEVMLKLHKFIGKTPLIAHNASFDKKSLEHELKLIKKSLNQQMACSLLVARRLYQDAPNHKLRPLIEFNKIRVTGSFHRALADAEMTARLWLKLRQDLVRKFGVPSVDFEFMLKLMSIPKKDLLNFIK